MQREEMRTEVLEKIILLAEKIDNTKEIREKLKTFEYLENYFNEPSYDSEENQYKYGMFLLESASTAEDLVLSKRRYNMDDSRIVNISDKEILEFLDEAEFSVDQLKLIQAINEYKSIVKEIIEDIESLENCRIEIERLVLPSYYEYAASVSDKLKVIKEGNVVYTIGLNILYGIYCFQSYDIEYQEEDEIEYTLGRCLNLYISDYLNENKDKNEMIKLMIKLHSLINNLIMGKEIKETKDIESNLFNFFIRMFRSINCKDFKDTNEFIKQNIDKIVILNRFLDELDVITWDNIRYGEDSSQEILSFMEDWISNIHELLVCEFDYEIEYLDLVDLHRVLIVKDIYPFSLHFECQHEGEKNIISVNILNKNSFDDVEISFE